MVKLRKLRCNYGILILSIGKKYLIIVRGVGMEAASHMVTLMTIINLILLGLGIYTFVLFVKLAHRGIKALDIYLSEKNKK